MAQSGFTPVQLYRSTTPAAVPLAADLAAGELAINIADMKLYAENASGVVTLLATAAGASGDVVGPASATENAVARFDGTTGKLIQNSVVTIADSTGNMAGVGTLGVGAITTSGALTYGGVTLSNAVTGTGNMVLSNSPTFVTPALGTPASGVVTNLTGTASININGTVGATTASTGAFTTLAASGAVTLDAATANGVAFANASKVLTTGSALTFDGTTLGAGLIVSSAAQNTDGQIRISNSTTRASGNKYGIRFADSSFETNASIYIDQSSSGNNAAGLVFGVNAGTGGIQLTSAPEQMRLTSTGLGIGTSSPGAKLDVNGGALIQGLTVGRGAGAVSSNTAVGAGALAANTSGTFNTAFGYNTLPVNTTGERNTGFGYNVLGAGTTASFNTGFGFGTLNLTTGNANTGSGYYVLGSNTTGANNTAHGYMSLFSNTTASNNTAVGYQALYSNTVSMENTAVGYQALYNQTTASTGQNVALGMQAGFDTNGFYNTFIGYKSGLPSTGNQNTFIGHASGSAMTTGSKNTILGLYNGNQGGLDIRTASNHIVLSDGDGNPLISTADNQTVALEGAVPNSGTGITFPATQSASSNANTLDDYEEGTFTATFVPSTSGTITLSGSFNTLAYTKVGRVVTITGEIVVSSASTPIGTSVSIGGFPFAAGSGTSSSTGFSVTDLGTLTAKVGRISTTSITADMFITASTIDTNSNFIFGFSYIV